MPPRKTDASKAATGDEGTNAPAPPKKEDGINIEVNYPIQALHVPSTHTSAGSQSPKVDRDTACKGCAPAEHADTGQCHAGIKQERNRLCELCGYAVRTQPLTKKNSSCHECISLTSTSLIFIGFSNAAQTSMPKAQIERP
jgi:hypothetical protein